MRSKWWLAGSAALMVLGVIFGCFISVPTGYVGMLTTFGRVENDVLGAGFHIKAPWQNVVCMNIQEQRSQFAIEAFSADIQQVNIVGSINFSIDQTVAAKLYREVGAQYADTLIVPRVYENTKAVFSRYAPGRRERDSRNSGDGGRGRGGAITLREGVQNGFQADGTKC